MNTFTNIFKNSFLEGVSASNVTTTTILVTLFVTCILATYIFLIYYVATRKTFYSKSFNVSLAIIAIITASIILAMQSNLIISLGMVGALSIVRFRTAIKDPMDLIFLFWSISIGIICGANMYEIAIITSIVITVFLFVLEQTKFGRAAVLLVINAETIDAGNQTITIIKKYSKMAKVKSRSVTGTSVDLIVECKPVKDKESELLKEITQIKEVFGVSLMEHDGEVTI